jgi:hypothetical protein
MPGSRSVSTFRALSLAKAIPPSIPPAIIGLAAMGWKRVRHLRGEKLNGKGGLQD